MSSVSRVGHFRISSLLLPKLVDIFMVSVFLAVIGMGPRLLNIDGDLGRHLVVGSYILDFRAIPVQDIFSHTLYGQALTPHEWLAEVIYTLAYRVLGLSGVVLLCALLISATFGLVYLEIYRQSQNILLSLGLVILAAAASSLHWLARPHLFTMLLTILWMMELERMMRGESKKWWIFPLIMLFWVNLHGAFIVGFVLLIMAGLGWFWMNGLSYRRWGGQILTIKLWTWSAVGSGLVTLVNPSGIKIWATSLGYIQNQYLTGHTAEYLSPDFHQSSTWPFLLLIILSLLIFAFHKNRSLIPQFIFVGGWVAMGLYSVRNIPIMAIVTAPILGELLADEFKLQQNWNGFINLNNRLGMIEQRLIGLFWPVVLIILVVWALSRGIPLDFNQQGDKFDPQVFPVQAAGWLIDHPQAGNMFNDFTWGGYLLFRLWPSQRVFIDGQTDFYGEKLTRQYEAVITLQDNWQTVFQQYQVDWVIMPVQSDLVHYLNGQKTWKSIYKDQTAVILRYEPNP